MRNNIVPCHTKGPRFIQPGPDLGIRDLSQLCIQSILNHSNSMQSGVWSSTSFALLLQVIRAFCKLLKEDLCNSQFVFNGLLIASPSHSLSLVDQCSLVPASQFYCPCLHVLPHLLMLLRTLNDCLGQGVLLH